MPAPPTRGRRPVGPGRGPGARGCGRLLPPKEPVQVAQVQRDRPERAQPAARTGQLALRGQRFGMNPLGGRTVARVDGGERRQAQPRLHQQIAG
ncbi:hypothetical protein [Streptomyces longispororuber]|uniref:hypothetical protein n=1 Tax=Streptomyces longispororuber TaxID=68230 RepID=UPI0021090BEF|nr:hypothetical protein [Streptomyces longispororuber]MCQ4208260.1 hypothetical protein [Streptomyces longispororuber]